MLRYAACGFLLSLTLCVGCSWIMGGTDERVIEAETTLKDRVAEVERERTKLGIVEADFIAGKATEAELQAAREAFAAAVSSADEAVAELSAAMDAVEERFNKLPGIGGAAGSAFGPIGTLIGTGLGTALAAFLGWKGTKNQRSLVGAYQEGRKVLKTAHPEAAQLLDDTLAKHVPAPIQKWIRKAKGKGIIPKL